MDQRDRTLLGKFCSARRVLGLPPIIKLACGRDFLVAEAEEGDLWVLGDNTYGQLGLGHTDCALQPTRIDVEERSEGRLRCLVALCDGVILIDSQGGVFSAGANSFGQLGRTSGDLSKLQRISDIPPMLGAACGFNHTLSLDANGGVWTWGLGTWGQLGTGNTYDQSLPILAPLEGVSALAAGRHHSLVYKEDGGLLVFGSNGFGQLGLNHRTNKIVNPTLTVLQPALPHSVRRREKSARSSVPFHERESS